MVLGCKLREGIELTLVAEPQSACRHAHQTPQPDTMERMVTN